MNVRIVRWSSHSRRGIVESFLGRRAFDEKAENIARSVLADIRAHGSKAISKYVKCFDGVSLDAGDFRVKRSELIDAHELVDANFRSAVAEAHKRITAFAERGMRKDWSMASPRGGLLGEQFNPLDRVGVYVPGGTAPLVSTALMTVTLGKVAGVPEIVACTPCGCQVSGPAVGGINVRLAQPEAGCQVSRLRRGFGGQAGVRKADLKKVNPFLLYALETAGATEIYRVGGIQAIGLMAYGTRTIRKVQKIVGPGGTYVTAAKRQVYGEVALDLVAGPSEIAVFADDSTAACHVAADLLSQAEHGSGYEKVLLVTPSMQLAKEVREELKVQTETLSRKDAVQKIMEKGMLLVIVKSLDEGMDLCNRFAPEHLEIMVSEPKKWLKKVRSAGAVFVGTWSPETAGDFVAGPSHVLPTGGTAVMFSGLTVDDFRRRSSIVEFTRTDLTDVLPVIESFGRVEGLDAHVRSARVRFEKK